MATLTHERDSRAIESGDSTSGQKAALLPTKTASESPTKSDGSTPDERGPADAAVNVSVDMEWMRTRNVAHRTSARW